MAHAVVQINDSERESGEVVNRRGVERSASFRRFRNVPSRRGKGSSPWWPWGGKNLLYIRNPKMSSQRHTGIKTPTITTTRINWLLNQWDWAGRKRGPIHTTRRTVGNALLNLVWNFFGPCVGMIGSGLTATGRRKWRGVLSRARSLAVLIVVCRRRQQLVSL
jgi:hypothetical protein